MRTKDAFVLWFTGLSGSGKTTLAQKIYKYLKKNNCPAELLDGDKIRSVLSSKEFSHLSRIEHIKRMGFMASVLEKNKIITIASFISPHRDTRNFIRKMCKNFIEIYLNPSLEICEKRDIKGLYKKAREGQIRDFTGISADYEKPLNPELTIDTGQATINESFEDILKFLKSKKYIKC